MTTEQQDTDTLRRLVAWINTHDCGCTPTSVLMNDGAIAIHCLDAGGYEHVDHVHTFSEARAVLGY